MLAQQPSQIHLLHQAPGHCSQLVSLPACDRMANQQALREFVSEYVAELKDLTFNSKALINTLTMLAGDNLEAASSIAAAIEKHALTCAPAHKLYALYLVDSIVKNIGAPYTTLFAGNMPEVFADVWMAAPQAQASLRKVLNTWNGIFPDVMLAAVSERISSPLGVQRRVPFSAMPAPAHMASAIPYAQGGPYLQQPTAAGVAPAVAFPAPAMASALPQSLSQYGSAYPQSAIPASVAPLPTPQQPELLRQQTQGSTSVQTGVPASSQRLQGASRRAGAAGLESLPDISAEELPLKYVDRVRLEFSAERIKAEDPQALWELLACSLALRPKHVDRRFLHRRRMRGKSIMSQQWFVNADGWVAGTAADVQAAPAFFDIEAKDKGPKQEVSVPADTSQPVCALSGERFDTFWDDAHEEWRFRDAVRLTAEQAARYGVQEGTIVKVSCLSDNAASAGAAEIAAEEAAEEDAAVQGAEDAVETPGGFEAEASVPAAAPAVKEDPGLNEQEAKGSLGVKREAENSEDAQAVAKRIKTEPA